MNRHPFLLYMLSTLLVLSGCKTVHVKTPPVEKPAKVSRVQQTKNTLKNKKSSVAQVPSVLGGLVKSDDWVIYPDKAQEEFLGHVSYDNGIYTFKADYALSERNKNRFTAKGNVYLKQQEKFSPSYEAYADYAQFNYKTQKGVLTSAANKRIKLIYTDGTEPPVTVMADKGSFDLATRIFIFEGKVLIERTTPEGMQTMSADKATIKQTENFVQLEGNATLSDGARTLAAETIVYDGTNNKSYAYGDRPLAYGTTEQGTFAIIADKVSSDAEGNQIILDGKVQGWLVSPELNKVDTSKYGRGLEHGIAK